MNNYRIYGRFVTKSPLSHIAETHSTNNYLSQDPILQPNGTIEDVFSYSGNGWRGQLRDCCADYLLRKMGVKIPLKTFHLLYSGGTIGGDQSIDIEKAKAMRKTIPMVSLFGGGIGTQIMQGKLKIGSSHPICVEAIPVLHVDYHHQALKVSYADLTMEKSFTRFDDSKKFDLHEKINIDDQHLLETKANKKDSEVSTQMRMTSELLIAGVSLPHEIDLVAVNDVELGAFVSGLIEFSNVPFIGGQSNRGHGRVDYYAELVNLTTGERADLFQISDNSVVLSEVAQSAKDAYDAMLVEKRIEIINLLGVSPCGSLL